MNIYEKLSAMQVELKVPKDEYNSFGKYNYRNCETIFENIKPLLQKYKVFLSFETDVKEVGGEIYMTTTAVFVDIEKPSDVVKKSVASREEKTPKGSMSAAQSSGANQSYSMKYLLYAVMLLDDTKDADTEEYTKATKNGGKAPAGTSAKPTAKTPAKSEEKAKPPVISGKVPPATLVLNNEGNYVTLESLPTVALQKIVTMPLFKPAWTDIKAVLAERETK